MLAPSVGGDRKVRYSPLISLVLGTTLGGVGVGILVAALAHLFAVIPAARSGVLIGLGTLSATAVALPGLRRWLPDRTCQVRPYHVYMVPLTRVAFRWGIELGVGVCTFIVTPAFFALLAVAVTQPLPQRAAMLLALYGAARGLTIAYFAMAQSDREIEVSPGLGLERRLRVPMAITVLGAVLFAL